MCRTYFWSWLHWLEKFNDIEDPDEYIGDDLLIPDGRAGPRVYGCANSKLIELDDGSSPGNSGARKECSALLKDKVFVLLKEGNFHTFGTQLYMNIKSRRVNHIG